MRDGAIEDAAREGVARDADALVLQREVDDLPRLALGAEAVSAGTKTSSKNTSWMSPSPISAGICFTWMPGDCHVGEQDDDRRLALVPPPRRNAGEQEAGVGLAGIGRPDLRAVDAIAALDGRRRRAQRGEVGAGARARKSPGTRWPGRARIGGRYLSSCAGVPYFISTGPTQLTFIYCAPRGSPAAHISSPDELVPDRRILAAMLGRPVRDQQAFLGEHGCRRPCENAVCASLPGPCSAICSQSAGSVDPSTHARPLAVRVLLRVQPNSIAQPSWRRPAAASRMTCLRTLPAALRGSASQISDLLGDLEDRRALRVEEGAQRRDVRARLAVGHDHRAGALAGARVGQADDGDVGDVGMLDEQVLDLLGRDILAVADDDVLGAAGDDQIVAVDPAAEIAHAEEAVAVETPASLVGVQIADQHLRSSRPDFALVHQRRDLGNTKLCRRSRRHVRRSPDLAIRPS